MFATKWKAVTASAAKATAIKEHFIIAVTDLSDFGVLNKIETWNDDLEGDPKALYILKIRSRQHQRGSTKKKTSYPTES